MPSLGRMVEQIGTLPPSTMTVGVIDILIPRIDELLHSTTFANIEQTNQPAQPELGIEGHQGRAELSLVNHYETLQNFMTRLRNRRDILSGHISSGGRKKYRKSYRKKKKTQRKKKNTMKKQKRKY